VDHAAHMIILHTPPQKSWTVLSLHSLDANGTWRLFLVS